MLSLRRIILISRPIGYIPSVAVFVAGVVHGSAAISPWLIIFGSLFFTLPFGLIAYGINDIADRETDALNDRKGGIDGAQLQTSEVRSLAYTIATVAIAGIALFLVMGRPLAAVAILAVTIISYIYSMPPIRLKARPIIDSFVNGLGIVSIYLAGCWATANQSLPSLATLITITLFTAGVHALGTVVDHDVDKKFDEHTSAVALGKRLTLLWCVLLFASCILTLRPFNIVYAAYFIICVSICLFGLKYDSPQSIRNLALGIILGFAPIYVLGLLV